jgi:HIRAN domain
MTIEADALGGADSATTPLLAGTIHGVRSWSLMVDGDSGRDLLGAMARDVVWPRRRPMRALCVPGGFVDEEHEAPSPDCTCGIYSHHPFGAEHLLHNDLDDGSNVLGLVEAWGRVEVHAGGFRAEYARPTALIADADCYEGYRHRVERLARGYGAEYVELEDHQAIVDYCEGLPNGLSPDAVGELLTDRTELELHADAQGYLTRRGRAIGGVGYYLEGQDEPSPWSDELECESPEVLILRVAGTTHRRAALQRPECAPGRKLRLLAEPTNRHDPNAVGVWDAALRTRIGYVPRAHAADVRRRLAAGRVGRVMSMWEWRDLRSGERFGLHMLISRTRRIRLLDQETPMFEEEIES